MRITTKLFRNICKLSRTGATTPPASNSNSYWPTWCRARLRRQQQLRQWQRSTRSSRRPRCPPRRRPSRPQHRPRHPPHYPRWVSTAAQPPAQPTATALSVSKIHINSWHSLDRRGRRCLSPDAPLRRTTSRPRGTTRRLTSSWNRSINSRGSRNSNSSSSHSTAD